MDEIIPILAEENGSIQGRKKRMRKACSNWTQIHLKRSPFCKRSRENTQKKAKSKVRKLDMSRFAPPKAKRPANLWAALPSPKVTMTATTNAMTRTASLKMNTTTNPIMTSTCRTCKRWGLPCPFCVQSTPHPSPVVSDWSNEDWDRDKQQAREAKEREQLVKEKEEQNSPSSDYHPFTPICDPTFKQDPLLQCTPKEMLALDPKYNPQNYDPIKER